MLSQRYRIAIRRHLGIPFANTAQAGRLMGWRYAIHVEDLEFKLSNLQPNEEQLITGNAMASWQVNDRPSVGDVLTFIVNDATGTHTVTYTVQEADLHQPVSFSNPVDAAPTYSIALNAAAQLNNVLGPLGYQAQGAMPADLFSPQYFPPYFAEVILTAPSSAATFTIAGSVSGTTGLAIAQQPYPSPIAAIINGVQLYGYVTILDALAMRPLAAEVTLWIAKADVVAFRPDEVLARKQPYRYTCEMLSRDLGGQEYVERLGHFSGGARPGAVS